MDRHVNGKQQVQMRRRRSRKEVERLAIEFEASGLRLMEFCRKHGLPPSTLQRQLKRQSLGHIQAKQDKQLVAVALVGRNGGKDARGASALRVVLSSGRRIEVWPDFDSGTLKRLLGVLESNKAPK